MKLLSLCGLFLILSFSYANADTHPAATCSVDDVTTAYNAATAGDIVAIPAGTCDWASALSVGKGVTIQGAGATTVLNATGTRLFTIPTTSTGNIRLTAMKFTGVSSGGVDIRAERGWTTLRIDNITSNATTTSFADIGYSTHWDDLFSGVTTASQKVLIDNITYSVGSSVGTPVIKVYGRGHRAWQEVDDYGSDNFVFIEDSTFEWTGGATGYVTDTEFGARLAVRYNTVTNGGIYTHDTGTTPRSRGNRLVELYNNTMSSSVGGIALNFVRGGTGIGYSNTFSGFDTVNNPEIYRVAFANSFLYAAYCTDTTTTKVCQDTAKHCASGTRVGRPCYTDGDCPSGACNTAYTCTADSDCKDFNGTDGLCMQIDGDADDGYPCRDQLGRGKDNATTGVQDSSPLFWYSNTVNGTPNAAFYVGGYGAYEVENRDYCNHDTTTTCNGVTVSYTAYAYPHPLRGESGTTYNESIGFPVKGFYQQPRGRGARFGVSVQ